MQCDFGTAGDFFNGFNAEFVEERASEATKVFLNMLCL